MFKHGVTLFSSSIECSLFNPDFPTLLHNTNVCTDLFKWPISPEDTLEERKYFFAMISTSSMKIHKKRKYNGHFCSAPGCSNSYGKDKSAGVKRSYYSF